MKHIFTSLFVLAFITSGFAVNTPVTVDMPTQAFYGVEMPDGQMLSLEDIIKYKPRQLAKKHGVKLKFKQRVALGLVRGKLKKAQRKGKDLNSAFEEAGAGSSGFHFGGFILGLLLGLLGWLLAILIWPRMGAGRSALLGWAIWLIVALLFIV